jgi:TonB family protein
MGYMPAAGCFKGKYSHQPNYRLTGRIMFRMSFNRALIISFLWHLFWFFAITIVVVPIGSGPQKLSDVSFLGSILDEDSFHSEFRTRRDYSFSRGKDSNRLFFQDKSSIFPQQPQTGPDRVSIPKEQSRKISITDILDVEKRPPTLIGKEAVPQTGSKSLKPEDAAVGRTVLFRPPLPDCRGLAPIAQQDLVIDFYRVKVRVIIASDGHVKSVEKLESSGYPEIDLAAIRYVEKWTFSPLAPNAPQADQEAVLLFKFNAR